MNTAQVRAVSRSALLTGALLAVCGSAAIADTYQVGPTRQYTNLAQVEALLNPGDLVEVDGGTTYPAVRFTQAGTAANPITIRGLRVSGNRPILSGGTQTVQFEQSHHYLLEGFEVTGGLERCVFVHAGHITIRDTLVRDCPKHGILGADEDSGWLTLEYVEVARAGTGTNKHPIYVSSDPYVYPGATFRMQHSYVHDGNGGNAIKSRAERNEIYYNWIENGFYRELELIGTDPDYHSGPPPRPMDSDVVGNVFIKGAGRTSPIVRVGHDDETGTSGSHGRFRFVNNTFVADGLYRTVFQLYGLVTSIEAHNNVFYRRGGPTGQPDILRIVNDGDVVWVAGPVTGGSNNWLMTGSTMIPSTWTGSITGGDPGFANFAAGDLRPAAGSPLINAGTTSAPSSPAGHAFPSPLYPPTFHPPVHTVGTSTTARPVNGVLDLGAYESSSPSGCSYGISPTSANFDASGGVDDIGVATAAGCAWTAVSNVGWIAVTAGASGNGSGSVDYSVQTNSSTSSRSGSLTVAGQSFSVTQQGAAGCTYSIAPTSASVGTGGGSGTVSVTAGSGCAWTATSNAAWLTVTSGASGTANGSVGYSAASNAGAARGGTITIAGQTFSVSQAGTSTGSVVDVYIDQTNVTFTGGSAGVQAATVSGEGVGGSVAIKHTGLTQWAGTKRLHFATPVDISAVLGTDMLQISLDLSAGGPASNSIWIYFNDNWQAAVTATNINATPGYQTFTINISAIRSLLGNSVNDIYFKAGNGFPANGTLWVDDIKFVRP